MRKIITLPLITLLALTGLWLGGAVAAAAPAHHACTVDVDVTHSPSLVQAHGTACGDRYRAVGYWGGERDLGTYMLTAYSTACDVSPSCQGHPDGTLFSGGWQDRRTGKYHQTFTTARTMALVKKACTQDGQQSYTLFAGTPSAITAWFTSNPCGHLQSPELLDVTGGYHYGDSWRSAVGAKSTASSPQAMSKAWVRWRATTTSQIWCFRVYPTLGTGWFKANGDKC